MAPPTAEDVLTALHSLNASHEITILKLSEPISASIAQQKPQDQQKQQQRSSDISTSSLQQEDATTPSSLEADLTHYRELFAKLRFSYVEQVTKEKFIRAIVGDPPLIVTPQENVDLERRNLAAKAALKALKTEVADLAAELERRARELSRRYEGVRLETARLGELPTEIAGLEDAIARLREEAQGSGRSSGRPDRPENPDLSLPLAKTLELVEARKRQRAELDHQLEQLQSQVPRKKKELERLQAELQPLEAKRQNSTAAAKEARRRKEQALGGVEDDLEERGRWYRAADATLRQMLEIES
ncbi:hypothetical protein DL770_007743 [Monosporascus sp. CRB-9-2]|nr:hypothetical protein DL770_007743 [Monosporascus sp. CRB-9-2]